MSTIKNHEFQIPKVDIALFNILLQTLQVEGKNTFPENYYGPVRFKRECRDHEGKRVWFLSAFIRGDDEPGSIIWTEVMDTPYATIDGNDESVVKINFIRRKFDIYRAGINALDYERYPSSVILMLSRLCQALHDYDFEIVDFITNDMYCEMDGDKVEVMNTFEVVGAKFLDIRRIDTLVVSRKYLVGVDAAAETLQCWPIVICGKYAAFNQFVPGPVMALGNLARHYDVLTMNTKDVTFRCNTQFELEYEASSGTGLLRKYHPQHDSWITYELTPQQIRPMATDDQLAKIVKDL